MIKKTQIGCFFLIYPSRRTSTTSPRTEASAVSVPGGEKGLRSDGFIRPGPTAGFRWKIQTWLAGNGAFNHQQIGFDGGFLMI